MSQRITFVLVDPPRIANCIDAVRKAQLGSRVSIQPPRRTLDQNAKMHAMIRDISQKRQHAGRWLPPRLWLALFMSGVGQKMEFLPALEGDGVVAVSPSSTSLSISDCSDLIELMYARGAEWGIRWSEPELWQHTPPADPA